MKVRYSYLPQQFADTSEILEEIRQFIPTGDFTLGKPLSRFEAGFAKLIGSKHAIGVGSGTDAIKLSLRAAGVGYGDEVITAANTFIATVGAISETGATTVLVDCRDDFCIDPEQIEGAITERTKAFVPVHLAGGACEMPRIMEIAEKHALAVVEDACQSILGAFDGKTVGTWGLAGAYSLHPLKNLNVWGDGGVIVTNDDAAAEQLRLLRNHGLKNRDEIVLLGHNSRLDTLQAIVGNWLIEQTADITNTRRANAAILDEGLATVSGITLPPRNQNIHRVYHLYIVFAERRDELYDFCVERGIECKVHYPIPLYQQEGLKHLGYVPGQFPVSDRHAREMITFPADQHLGPEEMNYVIETVKEFYGD